MAKGNDRPKVMLVDGTAEAEGLAEALADLGVEVLRAGDTVAAETLFVSRDPSLIVLDLEDDGASAFCDLVGAIQRGGGVPLVLLDFGDDDARRALEPSIRAEHRFLARPVDLNALRRAVARLLGLPEGEPLGDGDAVAETSSTSLSLDEPTVQAGPLEEPTELELPLSRLGADLDPESGHLPREPTQVLAEPGSAAEELLERGVGISLTDAFGQHDLDFDHPELEGPMPWEVGLDEPLTADTMDRAATGDVEPATEERTSLSEAPPEDDPAPWDATGEDQARPEAAAEPASSDDETTQSITELSLDFRRVIDEVAHRLFPEASPDEYQDEHFEDLNTVVPFGEQHAPAYDDLDDYSLEAMETFAAGPPGLTLSGIDDPVVEPGGDTHDDGATGAVPTQRRGVSEVIQAKAPTTPRARRNPSPDSAAPSARPPSSPPPRVSAATLGETPTLEIDGRARHSGALHEISVPELFAAAFRGRLDGRLVLRAAPPASDAAGAEVPRRVVDFDRGHPVAAASGLVEDRLIERLRRRGDLTPEQYESVRKTLDATGRRAGAVLVERGIFPAEELVPLVRWHFLELILSCFGWSEGAFWLEPRPPLDSWTIRLEPTAPEVLLEGLRRHGRADELEAKLGGRLVRLSPAPTLTEWAAQGLRDEERPLVAGCDGTRPLEAILAEVALPRAQALAVLYGLVLLGELSRGESGGEHESALARAARERLLQRIHLAREGDYFTLLGVSPDASDYEIRSAHESIQREIAPGRLAAIGVTDLDGDLEDLRFVLDEALDVLTEAPLREAYRRARF